MQILGRHALHRAFFALYAAIAEMQHAICHDVPIAIASDLNPGTSPILSLRLAMNMACTLFRLTPEEALRGVTINAARALGLDDRGTLALGQRADLAVWPVDHLAELCYWIGGYGASQVFAGGKELV